jgi:AcrR family transcriptional regulator
MTKSRDSRPGGRSTRVREAVFSAVEALLDENPGDMPTMAAIAAREQVNPTSLYRRWSDVRMLVGAVAVERLMREYPMPDTGSLRGDLVAWAKAAAASIGSRRNIALLRILTAVPLEGVRQNYVDNLPIGQRVKEIEAMLTRAAKRGEATPTIQDILELVLGPIYLRGLFLGPPTGTNRHRRHRTPGRPRAVISRP